MIGSGENKKSMAYIGNVTEFLMKCIESDKIYAVFNYVDTPDLDMNALVKHTKAFLGHKNKIRARIPYHIALILGCCFDIYSKLRKRPLPISSKRIRKFCSTSSFATGKSHLDGFKAKYTLKEGLDLTLKSEFLAPDPNKEVFYTE